MMHLMDLMDFLCLFWCLDSRPFSGWSPPNLLSNSAPCWGVAWGLLVPRSTLRPSGEGAVGRGASGTARMLGLLGRFELGSLEDPTNAMASAGWLETILPLNVCKGAGESRVPGGSALWYEIVWLIPVLVTGVKVLFCLDKFIAPRLNGIEFTKPFRKNIRNNSELWTRQAFQLSIRIVTMPKLGN